MYQVKFIDGTPVPEDYLALVSQLVHEAALAVEWFGEGELEDACRERTSQGQHPLNVETKTE